MPACPTPTARLRFRPVEANDFAAVHAYAGDPAVTRYTSFGPNSEEDTRGFLARAVAATADCVAPIPLAPCLPGRPARGLTAAPGWPPPQVCNLNRRKWASSIGIDTEDTV
jgi:hypothetical protein